MNAWRGRVRCDGWWATRARPHHRLVSLLGIGLGLACSFDGSGVPPNPNGPPTASTGVQASGTGTGTGTGGSGDNGVLTGVGGGSGQADSTSDATGPGVESATDDDGTGETSAGSTDSAASESTGGSETTEGMPPEDAYQDCAVSADCPTPGATCLIDPFASGWAVCVPDCTGAIPCPAAAGGVAPPVCLSLLGYSACGLDCSQGACPGGMSCVGIEGVSRCVWPA